MAACSSRALPCSRILSLHQHPHHLNVSQRASAALLTKPSRRLGAALRLAASASSTAATSSAGSSTSSFVQLYAGLAGVLAPGGAVAARPTPLGRGLVAEQPAAKGDTLLSGKLWSGLSLIGMTPLCRSHAWHAHPSPARSLCCRLAVDWANMLCVTDQPKTTGNAFGRRCLEDWQMLHGPLPPLLQRYLLAGACYHCQKCFAAALWPLQKEVGSMP